MKKWLIGMAAVMFLLCAAGVNAVELGYYQQGDNLGYYSQGATLGNAPDYDWWYGCSATSAGMMMGYYDRNGYGGLTYNNLDGDTSNPAPLSNYTGGGAGALDFVASSGHIADFWTGYGNSGDDPNPSTNRSFDCLADFMGTSQDSAGQSDGSTGFTFFTNGTAFTATNAVTYNVWNSDGMYGMYEYFNYSGYTGVAGNFYTQLTDNDGLGYSGNVGSNGFTLAEYKAEIDAGKVVMIHVEGHSMFGYGYDGDNIILHDTWNAGTHSMAWGGAYSGLTLWGVTCFTPTGGDDPTPPAVPEPATMVLFGMGLLGLSMVSRRKDDA